MKTKFSWCMLPKKVQNRGYLQCKSYIYWVLLPQMVINCSFDGHIRQSLLQEICGSPVDQLLLLAHGLKLIYGPKTGQKSVKKWSQLPLKCVRFGFSYLNDIVGGQKNSESSDKVQGNKILILGPNFIVGVKLKMTKIGPNKGLSIA